MLLQLLNHWTQIIFEVSPLKPGINVFLPFWWITKHAPSGTWDYPELCSNSLSCLKHSTKSSVAKFSLVLNESILHSPEARIIG